LVKYVPILGWPPRYQPAWLRFDLLAGMMLGVAVGLVGTLLTTYTADGPAPMDRLIIYIGLVFSVAYYLVAWTRSGQTLGKMVLGIKIVGAGGQPPSGGKAVLR
jgi:uncharacterized RDD family membrane protein YckC